MEQNVNDHSFHRPLRFDSPDLLLGTQLSIIGYFSSINGAHARFFIKNTNESVNVILPQTTPNKVDLLDRTTWYLRGFKFIFGRYRVFIVRTVEEAHRNISARNGIVELPGPHYQNSNEAYTEMPQNRDSSWCFAQTIRGRVYILRLQAAVCSAREQHCGQQCPNCSHPRAPLLQSMCKTQTL